ncbi:MAG TPA: AraC family transcriptional regulator [Chitinophagaceae bacterium]|jgi:AraC-like DNA-binding protein|nr:AraC family transcriptional regulator [Chitinophagaceae bacterium]
MKVIQFTIPVDIDNSFHMQEDRLPYFYRHLHRHTETQITWIVNGEGTLIIGNNMLPFRSGDLFVIGANQPHVFKNDPSYFIPNNRKKIHSLNIFFNPVGYLSQLLEFPEMLGIKKFIHSSRFGLQASEKDAAKLAEQFLKIRNCSAGFRLAYFIELLQVMANLKGWQFLSTESFEYAITDTEGLRMNDIYQYTMDHFTEVISLEQIAAVACLTPQSFCRYFKKHTSKTYINFLNEVRINEACKKFMEKNYESIGNVAYQCGFNSVVSFNRVFKGIMGKTPRDFIRTYHDEH